MKTEETNRRPRLYFAAPLFSKAELDFNINLKQMLNPYFNVFLPQEDGGLMDEMVSDGAPPKLAAMQVFGMDVDAMDRCDILLIILDGRSVDEGAAFELGYAFAKGKMCYGLKTGPRQLLCTGNNPMIDGPLIETFRSIDSLIAWAKKFTLSKQSKTLKRCEEGLSVELRD